ncbi:cupin domain-containing protein [Sporichthya sp.]|uniref:cupin domain-containing protein n=1 Tax=Sporichthya sp. TaxID=65475 RepID=UPI001804033E|nr:cupin domain-containing protein [Sporichthya sp.]MBA3742800.1 cupin domain-containing protein [Sporichthya sp.]
MTTYKRVVTGVDAKGTSIFYADEAMPKVQIDAFGDAEFYQVWGTEGTLRSPVTDPAVPNQNFFPGPGGSRFGILTLPPAAPVDPDAPAPDETTMNALFADGEDKLPGLLGIFEPDNPGMHQTVTVDYAIVISGELWLELDDGAEVHLPTGSCVVQNGARHAWHNKSSAPATLAYVLMAVA